MKWSDITLRQFARIYDAVTNPEIEEVERKTYIMEAVNDKPFGFYDDMDIAEFMRLYEKAKFVKTFPDASNPQLTFTVKGESFTIDPDAKNWHVRQTIDIMKMSHKPGEMLAAMFAVLVSDKSTTPQRQKELTDLFNNHLTVDIAYPIMVFFWAAWMPLFVALADYSVKAESSPRR